ncbi:MAG: MBL fold metallo-hydrolase [Actinomycetota bacterium]
MHVKIWGCRGSLPTTGPDTLRYGGDTACVEVNAADGSLIILDAGTGIRSLGISLQRDLPRTVHLLFTHLHLDHLIGFGFFAPLWSETVDIHIWGPPSPFRSFEELLVRYVSPPLFPVHIGDMPSHLTIHDVTAEQWQVGSATISADPVQHQGPTIGYRISENGRSLAYLPDHEPARGADLTEKDPDWLSGNALAQDVDVLIHDAQYTKGEYQQRVGWGHSSVEDVVKFAHLTRAKHLIMFHHDPLHGDDQLDSLQREARSLARDGLTADLAREFMEFDL